MLKNINALLLLLIAYGLSVGVLHAEDRKVILVVLDGIRWQEIFRGADPKLASDPLTTHFFETVNERFVAVPDPPSALTPFIHQVIAKQGVLIGDRAVGCCSAVKNPYWFSYPGYNELFTGYVDRAIDAGVDRENPNVTVFEWLQAKPKYRNKVRLFGSWESFDHLVSVKRSGLPVNAGFRSVDTNPNDAEKLLNQLQDDLPRMWHNVRNDALTFRYAMESFKRDRPEVLFIGLGESDDYGHARAYDQYLFSLARADRFIKELWTAVQADRRYKNRTTLIVTTDHGRGDGKASPWTNHGSGLTTTKKTATPIEIAQGSDETWAGLLGPDIAAQSEHITELSKNPCVFADQVAATLLQSLKIDPAAYNPATGKRIGKSLLLDAR